MKRLVSICLIDTQDRPKGFIRPTWFCKSNLWDVAVIKRPEGLRTFGTVDVNPCSPTLNSDHK